MPIYQTILYAVDHAVATLRLNRPDRRNALTQEMLSELRTAIEDVADDDDVRAVLITGEGPTFCAGQDLSIFTGKVDGHAVREAIVKYYKPLILAMVELQ